MSTCLATVRAFCGKGSKIVQKDKSDFSSRSGCSATPRPHVNDNYLFSMTNNLEKLIQVDRWLPFFFSFFFNWGNFSCENFTIRKLI